MSRVDRVAAQLGLPTEDLRNAMREHAVFRNGPDAGRIAALSVRLGGTRTFRYSRSTNVDATARGMGITPMQLRDAMRMVASAEGRKDGVWTMSVRVW